MPATAICWSTYEFFKYILGATKLSDSHSPKISHHNKEVENSFTELSNPIGIKARELPAMSGTGLYGAISFNTMHKAENLNCVTTRRLQEKNILDITHT